VAVEPDNQIADRTWDSEIEPVRLRARRVVDHRQREARAMRRRAQLLHRAVGGATVRDERLDLSIEVLSPSNVDDDRINKFDLYQTHGVPHYWLVDLEQRTIQQYTLLGAPYQGGRYGEPVVLREGDVLSSALFPNVSLAVDAVFQHTRGRRPSGR